MTTHASLLLSWGRRIGAPVLVAGTIGAEQHARLDLLGEILEYSRDPGAVTLLAREMPVPGEPRTSAQARVLACGRTLSARVIAQALRGLGY